MLGSDFMTMVILDDLVHQGGEDSVGVSVASIKSNSGVEVFASGKDDILEGITGRILQLGALVPDSRSDILGAQRFSAHGESGAALEVFGDHKGIANCLLARSIRRVFTR
jgi:hypothetical protein